MKNIKTLSDRFTVIHTQYNETAGMQKGQSTTRSLIKIYDNGNLLEEYTRSERQVWICISAGGFTGEGKPAISLDCKKSEKATKSTSAWSNRKKEGYECVIINSNY